MKILATTLLSMACLLSGPPAHADDATAEAKGHYKAGSDFYHEARYKEAIAEFETAYRLHPHGVIFFNLAQCYEKLGDIPGALRSYREYLRQVPNADDHDMVQSAIDNLTQRLSESGATELFVYSQPAGAAVAIDGSDKGKTPFSSELTAGAHKVGLSLEGYAPVSKDVDAAAGRSLELDISLQQQGSMAPVVLAPDASGAAPSSATAPDRGTSKSAPPPEKHRLWTWVALGASAVAVATGVGFGIASQGSSHTLTTTQHNQSDAQHYHDAAQSQALGANIAYGVAGAAGIASVGLFFVEGSF